jgi:glutathione reductase (NADPH)
MTMEYDYDFFVIGAGSGGVRSSRIAAQLGAKVAVAEEAFMGGTCVNVGCVPKKLLVYASHFMEDFHLAEGYGWSAENIKLNWQKLISNKNKEIERLNGIYQGILDRAGVDVFAERAVVTGPHEVRCGDKTFSTKNILVATGGRPTIPEFPGSEHVISSNEMFFLPEVPKRFLVVGGGYIGVEFAGIMNGLGADTTLSYRGELFLRGFDHSMREFIHGEMQKKGIKVNFNSNVESITKVSSGFEVKFKEGETCTYDQVLYATGRQPYVKGLGLESAGVELAKNGAIKVDEKFKSSCPSIYAVGDVIDRVQLTPVALAEGMFVAHDLFGNGFREVDYNLIPTAIFSQPEMATVGLTEESARESFGDDIKVYFGSFRPMKLVLTDSDEKTMVKMIVRVSTDEVLGVHMGGLYSGEIIQGIAVALKAGAKKEDFDKTIGIHPTSAEEFVTMRD